MIIKLSGHSLTAADVFQAERLQLQLSERKSTATMTISDSAPVLSVGDWIRIENGPGSGIVWRVKTIDDEPGKRTRNVSLEHAINTLRDRLMFGKVTTQMISGGSTATAEETIEYILSNQSDWQLGTISFSVSNPYHFSGDDLFSAIEIVSGSLEDCVWGYDFSSYPFTLNILQMDSEVSSEMRSDRNIQTLKRTIDRSRMYTRIYPIGKNNLKLDSEFLSKNEAIYGVISKTESDESISSKTELAAWAQERLDRHCEPAVTVTISGLDLSESTGEPLDSFTIGKICRVPLPEFSTTITERVTKLSYTDVINTPEVVTVTLANELTDVATILKEQRSGGARSGRNKADNEEEDHAWIVDTKEKVALVAEAVAGKDGDEPDWSRVAELTVDGHGIDARVTQAEGDIVNAWSEINQTESKISVAVVAAKSEVYANIELTASGIRSEVGQKETDLYSYIEQTASSIRTTVATADSTIYSTIIQTASYFNSEVSRRAKVFIQIDDPCDTPGNDVQEGDVWIQSVRIQNWTDMEDLTWEDANDYDWNQYAGSKYFVYDGTRWELQWNQGQVLEWHTDIVQDANRIALMAEWIGLMDEQALASLEISGDAINSSVSAAKSELYSYIRQTASNIISAVVDDTDWLESLIEQTASSIVETVARKNTTYIQLTDPDIDHAIIEGDVWIQSETVRTTWSELSAKTWSEAQSNNWRQYYDCPWFVWKNGGWKAMSHDADVVEIGSRLEVDEQHIALISRTVDENHIEMASRLSVTAQAIRGEVHAAKSTIYSVIEQTATSIRLEVASTASDLQSSIEQTASSITVQVSAAKSSMYSVVIQTASQIRSEVSNTASGILSTLSQTASQIRSEVSSTASSLSSSITQTAGQIRSEVASTASGLASSITQTASSIRSEVASANSSIWSSITQTSTQISLKVGKDEVISCINQTAESISISASRIDLSGYVTATTFNATKAKIDNLMAGNTTATKLLTNRIDAGQMNVLSEGTLSIPSGATLRIYGHNASWIYLKDSAGTYRHFLVY